MTFDKTHSTPFYSASKSFQVPQAALHHSVCVPQGPSKVVLTANVEFNSVNVELILLFPEVRISTPAKSGWCSAGKYKYRTLHERIWRSYELGFLRYFNKTLWNLKKILWN